MEVKAGMTSPIEGLWLVIPTANRHQYLSEIFERSQIPAGQRILIRTSDGADVPGAKNLKMLDIFNIQHWWNVGINDAVAHGAEFIAILNDDTKLVEGQLQLLLNLMILENSDLGYPEPIRSGGWGHCFIIRANSRVRPDERFTWWCGDHDLEMQARKAGGVSVAPIKVLNLHSNELTSQNPAMKKIIDQDISRFRRKYPAYTLRNEILPRGIRKFKKICEFLN